MGLTFPDIVLRVQQRRNQQSNLLTRMIQVRDRYNGDVVVPSPNADDEFPLPQLTPTLIANAVDNTAMRAASVMPTIHCPALDPARENGKGSLEYANVRRKALAYTWRKSYWNIGARRIFRHLAGYATGALAVCPDYTEGCMRIQVRDPLTAYPEPKAPEDLCPPCDVAFVYRKSAQWLKETFPDTLPAEIERWGRDATSIEFWDVVEWIDEDDYVYGLLGPAWPWPNRNDIVDPLRWTCELRRFPNKAGRCAAYVPRRVTLDTIATQVANIVGMADLMARLMQLDIRATEKAIYPDKYVLSKQGQVPRLVGGSWKSGYTGDINLVVDADAVGQLHSTPDPHNSQTIDRLERNINVSSGTVPQQVGETYGALRTGRGIDTLMGASVDPRVQELHELMEVAMEHVNGIVLASYKGYFGAKQYAVWSGWASDKGQVKFVPDTHFETEDNNVGYPIPGADVQTTTVELGQLLGAKGISLHTFRSMHPYIEDAEGEEQYRLLEDIDNMIEGTLLERAQRGEIPEIDLANIHRYVAQGMELAPAIEAAQRDAQARQASVAPPPGQEGEAGAGPPAGPPGLPPGAMPGLANPGAGAEQQLPQAVGPPPAGLDNFRQLVRAVQAPQAHTTPTGY